MSQAQRITARTALLAAGTAGFVALGAGISGADTLPSPAEELSPVLERALTEDVAPTMHSLVPEGAGAVAGDALAELQETAHNPDKPAPDLGAALPESGDEIVTPVGNAPNPVPPLTDTLAETQDATGLDGDPHDTLGHQAGAALEETAQHAGDEFEGSAHEAGAALEDTARDVLPHTVVALDDLREEVLPETSDGPQLSEQSLPQTGELTDLTTDNALAVDEGLNLGDPLGTVTGDRPATEHQSHHDAPGAGDLTGALVDGLASGEAEPVSLDGPLADAGLPQVAEGVDTQTAEDLVDGLSRGTDLLDDLDTSDLVTIEGGSPEQETPEDMVEHPTFMDLPGSEALPVVS